MLIILPLGAVFCRFPEPAHATKMKANWFVHPCLEPKTKLGVLLEVLGQFGIEISVPFVIFLPLAS